MPLLEFLLPAYVAEGKSHLTIAVGCTGGRHRSITVADRIRRELEGRDDVVRARRSTATPSWMSVERARRSDSVEPVEPPDALAAEPRIALLG